MNQRKTILLSAILLALMLGVGTVPGPTALAQDCGDHCEYSPFAALQTTISSNVAAPFGNALLHEAVVAEGLYQRHNLCGSVRLLTAMDNEVAGLGNSSQISGEAAGLIHTSISSVISSIFPPDPIIPDDACVPEGPPI